MTNRRFFLLFASDTESDLVRRPNLADRLSSVSIAILKKISTPAGATLYNPRMMRQVPVGISPGMYPGVALLREMKNSERRPPLHPRKPRGSVSELVERVSKR